MANTGPITITQKGISVKNAKTSDLILDTRYPFLMVDTTKKTSNQLIDIFFLNEPPNPVPTTPFSTATNNTLITKFKHGYKYVPFYGSYIFSGADFNGAIVDHPYNPAEPYIYSAYLTVVVDSTYVNIYVTKTSYLDGASNYYNASIAGKRVKLRMYIFVSDTLGGEVPKQG